MTREWINDFPGADKYRLFCRFLGAVLLSLIATPALAALGFDTIVSRNIQSNSTTAISPVFSTNSPNEVLLAFIATDYISGPNTTVTNVTGGGLTWEVVVRTNVQAGTSEIWRAFAPNPLSNVVVTATMSQPVMSSITVMAFIGADISGTNGSGAIGATASANAWPGAPSATLVTTRANSLVIGVGNDYDNPIPRTAGSGQYIMHEYLTPAGDTYWVQRHISGFPAFTDVTINDTAPIDDRYNLSVVEVLPAAGAQLWDMSGTVGPAGAGSGTLLFIPGALIFTNADSNGNFTFANMPNGTYTVQPSKPGYTFSPPSRSVTINGTDATGINFTATPIATYWTISGTISPAAIGSGTRLILGETGDVIADGNGNFTFPPLPNGTYTIVPIKTGISFSPSSRTVTINGANVTGVNFSAADYTRWTVSGTVSPTPYGSGTVLFVGESGDVVADSNGNFSFSFTNGTYTIYASKPGFEFSPAGQTVTVNGGNVTGVAFTARPVGQFTVPFDIGLAANNMIMLHTSRVLISAGAFGTTSTERVWDPVSGSMAQVPNPYSNLFGSGHSQLADGRILVVGGYDPLAFGAANASIFDPETFTWSALPNMAYRRWHPSATTLADGRALITSGVQGCAMCPADVPEILDPSANQFTALPTARLAVPHYAFTFLLPNGKVIDAGSNEVAAPTTVLDLATNTWSTVDPNVKDGHSAAMYEPGKILKSGTATGSGAPGNAAATTYVLDMTQPSPSWREVAPMAFPRAYHNTTLLPDGSVLVTGGGTTLDGQNALTAVPQAELWSPVTETWETLGRGYAPRLFHSTALLLPDARVLVAGGNELGPFATRAEIFSPPYLFKGARPTITSAPAAIEYGSTFTVNTPNAGSIARVSLLRPGAVTNSFNQDQRILSLAFTVGSGSIDVQAPANANLAPPGYYMLFIVNAAGAPSVAPFVYLAPAGTDLEAPTPPSNVMAVGNVGSATLTWSASTDNVGVALYKIYRSVVPNFTPGMATYAGETTATTFTNNAPSNTYYFKVTAQDVAGNVSDPSNEASVFVLSDTTPPTVSMTAPADGNSVTGSVLIAANAMDDVSTPRVQFKLDGNPLGNSVINPPYSMTWNSTTTSNGVHTLSAMATDAVGNVSEASVSVTVSNAVPTPVGLVAAYGFNEAAGVQATDASGQGNTGTISNATRTASGKFGGALSFNGTSAWVTVNDAPSLDLDRGMTLEAWVKPSAVTGWRTVILKEEGDRLAYALYSGNGASRPAGYVHTGADIGVDGTAAMVNNVWTHLAITYDATTLRMFVNGVEVSSTPAPPYIHFGAGAVRIGGNSIWGEYFKGIMDEVRIYNRALTAGEIQIDMTTAIP